MGIFNFFKKREPSMELYNLQNALRIANDCADLIKNTINPEVFFDRYNLYLEKLALLSEAQECKAIKVKGENLIQKYSQMSALEKRVSTTNEFIDRFWKDTCAKANTLKTEKGKNNRYQKFFDSLSEYNERMPGECIEYYTYIFNNAPRNSVSNRKTTSADKIDSMQRIEASNHYRNKLYKMFYKGYSEMPFVSQDRELNTNWIDQAQMFGASPAKEMMVRYSDGLLPGHVYMLYWIKVIHRKRIPVYFEYQYGINFTDEQDFLYKQGYLTSEMKLTSKGENAILSHYDVIEKHSKQK